MSKSQTLDVSVPADNIAKFNVNDWTRLERFLITGTEGGSYYASEKELSLENMKAALRCIKHDGEKVVNTVVDISVNGRAVKNDPAIAVLALALSKGDDKTRAAASNAVNKVCRIGTHIYQFAENLEHFRGWGRSARRAVGRWFSERNVDSLALQVIKYQKRNTSEGENARWSAKDLLILTHPSFDPSARDAEKRSALYDYIMDRSDKSNNGKPSVLAIAKQKNSNILSASEAARFFPIIEAFEALKHETSVSKIVAAIQKHKLPRECIPTKFHQHPEVQMALLENGIGATALIRNLGNMSASELMVKGSDASKKVCSLLEDKKYLKDGRVHPISVLVALKQYASGGGLRGSKSWKIDSDVVDALDEAFYTSFDNVEPSGKRQLLCLDVSASMAFAISNIKGVPNFTACEASAALALVTKRVEKSNAQIMGFSDKLVDIDISPKQRLDSVIKTIRGISMGATDCSLPMVHAKKNNLEIDAFVVYTDSETNCRTSPADALKDYRSHSKIRAKLIVNGMTSGGFSIAPENDPYCLDVVGFNSSTPQVISEFIRI